ncbi:iron chaperone [Acidovorax radicis]|uniref:iron chaperone n=1 Tax=Acidovorax radicis TaxID=758826 RepID=UPI0002375546|nr:DUF1801 domain-containing protein [Acidovorax radicis]
MPTTPSPVPRPATIAEYIAAAPAAGQPLLRALYGVLKRAAPQAQEVIKWNTPFFIEPRFVYAFSAHKAHASFAPPAAALAHFQEALQTLKTTKGTIVLPYDHPLPEGLIRQIAEYSVQRVRERRSDGFWE